MTSDKIRLCAAELEALVRRHYPATTEAKRCDPLEVMANAEAELRIVRHLLFVCAEIPKFLDEQRIDKAMRWLGFAQGVVWAGGMASIDSLKEMNRPDEA